MILIFVKIIGIYFCITGTFDTNYPEEYKQMLSKSFSYKFQYLTIVGLYITLFTIILYLVNQTMQLCFKKQIPLLKKTSKLLHAIILPIEILITLFFWSLFLYDPKLIVCEIVYEKCGLNIYKNFCLHLVPFLLLAIEGYYAKLTRSNFHIVCILLFGFSYYLFVRSIAIKENRWPYPFLEKVSEYQRIAIFFTVTLMCIIFYEISMLLLKRQDVKTKHD